MVAKLLRLSQLVLPATRPSALLLLQCVFAEPRDSSLADVKSKLLQWKSLRQTLHQRDGNPRENVEKRRHFCFVHFLAFLRVQIG